MKSSRVRLLLLICLLCLASQSAWAVKPKVWHLDQPADLLSGTLDNLAVTNRAELLLAPQIQRFPLDPKDADTVNTLAISPDDGTPYLGTGPKGFIYRIINNNVEQVTNLPEGQVFSLLFLPDKTFLAGTGGPRGAIYRVDPEGQTSVFWQEPSVRYVWSIVRDGEGNIYAATGSDGEIYRISSDGKNATRLARLANTHNVLSLTIAGPDRLVFGTDASGLIGAINTRTGKLRILYDAGDRSITALSTQADGSVYAAATHGGTEKASPPSRPQGRPDSNTSGSLPATSMDSASYAHGSSAGTASSPSRDRQQGSPNTIYRIAPNSLTTETISLPAMVLGITAEDAHLFVSTGNPGRIYNLESGDERYTSLLREDASYFTTIARAGKAIWVGASRPASVLLLKPDCAPQGAFTSAPLDANLLSLWGQIKVTATTPPETTVTVQTRSSNTDDVTGSGWSEWSAPIAIAGAGARPLIASPPARFLQIRLTLKSDEARRQTPLVRATDIPYQAINLPPEILSVTVTTRNLANKHPASADEWYTPDNNIEIEWQARDPNGDMLSFDLFVRQVGTAKWTRIARNLTRTTYDWEDQDLPDGLYELRAVATDALDNPPNLAQSRARISDPFVIDKTGPKIESVQTAPSGNRSFRVQARLVDKFTNVIAAQYSIDSSNEWVTLLPVDGIFDSPQESLDFETGPLKDGEHTITIRAADERGNVTRTSRTLLVDD